MRGEERRDIDIGDAITIGETERLIPNIGSDSLQATACHRMLTGVDKRDAPRLCEFLMNLHIVFAHAKGDVGHV